MRQIQLEKDSLKGASIIVATVEDRLVKCPKTKEMGKMPNNDYDIQELLQRDVYVNDTKVGVIVGERHHPNEARVRSMRIMVEPGVADEFMRKPAELAPLHKELIHSIRNDGSVKLSKSMRELQRRWRNTVRIDEKLYAPDEMMDRACPRQPRYGNWSNHRTSENQENIPRCSSEDSNWSPDAIWH